MKRADGTADVAAAQTLMTGRADWSSVGKKGKVAVYLTPKQIAAVEEAADHYAMFGDPSAPGQAVCTRSAADILRRAFEKTGEPWPW